MRHRGELTDQEGERLEPHLRPEKPATGRTNKDHRQVINGILWRERTGAPWRDLPERYGPWSTVYSRFWRWRVAGIWDRILAAVQRRAASAGEVDWGVHFVDGTVIRAHQHAGAKGGAPDTEALGTSRGGFSTKVHLRAGGQGQPISVLLTPGQQYEATVFEPLMHRGAIRRPGRGRPRVRPCRASGDKGYTGRRHRAGLRRRGIRHTIP